MFAPGCQHREGCRRGGESLVEGRHSWVVGIDIGGTWMRAVALRGNDRRAIRVRTPAGQLPHRLVRGGVVALRLGRAPLSALGVAARGVWTPAERARLRRALRPLASRVTVMSDVEAAYLGAIGPSPGVLVLAGTGSIVLGRDGAGRWHRAGGLGPLLGDEGSAFWIGRSWLRAAVAQRGGPGRLRGVAAGPDAVARIAAAAPRALRAARQGQRPARAIVRDAQARLASEALGVARRLHVRGPLTVSWAGGLMADARFRAGIWHALRRTGLAVRPRPPSMPAAEAAARAASSGPRPAPRRARSQRGDTARRSPRAGPIPTRRRPAVGPPRPPSPRQRVSAAEASSRSRR